MLMRIIAGIILLFLVLYAPWWSFLICAFVFTFFFNFYYEIILGGIILDALYVDTSSGFAFQSLAFLLTTSLLFVVSVIAKRRLVFYS